MCFFVLSNGTKSTIDICRDVAYISSGSIIAAAGNSSNSVNVVIWDTLAPPSTSRASIICHEGFPFKFETAFCEIGHLSLFCLPNSMDFLHIK
jgi:hypothetical protein